MLFLNPWMLLALAGVSIPVVIHLVRRQAAKPVFWGAMRFLMDTLSERRRRIEWEDLLLMAARCLLLALAALAVARPFVPPDAPAAWSFVLPAVLLGLALLGGSFVMGSARKRLLVRAAALTLVCLAAGMVMMEHWLNLRRFETSGRREVVIILDASTSMTRRSGTGTLFDDALEEVRTIVREAPRGTSFAIILGGPSPQALSATTISRHADVLAQLDGLQPVGGTFRAHEALGMATLILAAGDRPNKEILVFTDSQRHGWRFENTGAWQGIEKAWEALPAKPRLLLRRLPHAPTTRNVGIASIRGARTITGMDRPSLLRIEVENTGTEPITAGALTLEVDGKPAGREPLGLLAPGQLEAIEFHHRFTAPGPHVATARLTGADDLPGDNRADYVVIVRRSLKVLLVDGNPAGSFFERAAGYTALALAPAPTLVGGGSAGEDFLMDPVVVAAPDLTSEPLADAEVVVLADVARLPATLAAALADQIAAGCGLVVLAGPRTDPAFFNPWDGPDGGVLPLRIGGEATLPDGISPLPSTFRHEALAWASDARKSDLGVAAIRRWRKTEVTAETGVLAAAFNNGDPFLATRGYGRGRVVAAACAFDARAGNLAARTSFVPLVHELVSWAAGGGVDWNTGSSWSPSVLLDSRSSGGLAASYRRSGDSRDENLMERIDPLIDFDWGHDPPAGGLPNDRFVVTWTGRLLPPVTGEYQLDAEVDDRLTVLIDGRQVLDQSVQGKDPPGRVKLEAGRPVPVTARYEEDAGEAFVHLFWTPPGGVRHLIPSSSWLPGDNGPLATLEVTDPFGHPRQGTVTSGRRGRELRIDGAAVPGLYQVKVPPKLGESIAPLAGAGELPVVVRSEIAESRMELILEPDLAQLRARIDTLLPESTGDVLAVLSGRGFGREITRIVAVAAVLLLLLEAALARWVSRSRRIGDELRVAFAEENPLPAGKGGGR
ncbi:MAG: BatA domain-containing protein [Akkermansiaceae bacterium]|nr:BatA domain-containing protein [Akkermansiaceae bacterium]